MPKYFNVFNVFKCGRKILEIIDVSYKRMYMTTSKEEYFTEMLDHINEYNERYGKLFPSKKLLEDVFRVMEEEEKDAKRLYGPASP